MLKRREEYPLIVTNSETILSQLPGNITVQNNDQLSTNFLIHEQNLEMGAYVVNSTQQFTNSIVENIGRERVKEEKGRK